MRNFIYAYVVQLKRICILYSLLTEGRWGLGPAWRVFKYAGEFNECLNVIVGKASFGNANFTSQLILLQKSFSFFLSQELGGRMFGVVLFTC